MKTDIFELGLLDDEQIRLDEAALSLAAMDHAGVDLAPYQKVLVAISQHIIDTEVLPSSAHGRASLLAKTIADKFGFEGDRETYDDAENADLIRVIDRRQGLPVSLSILYVSAARRVGWEAQPLNVPGHVMVMIGDEASPVIVDPFRRGRVVMPDELAALVTSQRLDDRPAVRHIATMTNRETLVRLLMNQATRAEAAGRGRRALTLYERMTSFAPDHGDGWWQRARLELVDDRLPDARHSLTAMLEITRDSKTRRRIVDILESLVPSE
jgi:regulator of sirC expression with transglutaminase-like and TPR domain